MGREVSRYVDMTDDQEQQFDRALAELWTWHRHTELPQYASDLRELAQRADQPLTVEEARAYTQRYVDIWFRILRQGLPASCALLATLSDQQVEEVLAETQRDLDKYARKNVTPGEAKVRQTAEKKQLKTLRRWLGALSNEQRELLHRWAMERVYLTPAWLEYRKAWRAEFAQMLAARHQPEACTRLETLVVDPGAMMAQELKDQSELNQQQWAAFLAQLTQTLSEPQRAHLRRELLEFAQDFEELAAHK